MRQLVLVALILSFTLPVLAADGELRLEGVAFTEGVAKEIQVQVWALGDQVAQHEDWQFEAVFDGVVSPGKAFGVDLGEAKLPVLVELSAKDHAAVSLEVVLPEQLQMPVAWLRAGDPLRIRVSRSVSGDERLVVWGGFWVDGWSWDGRRWRVAVPHLEVPVNGAVETYRPAAAEAMWLSGASDSGAFGTAQERLSASTGLVKLKIDSTPMKVRVWDARKRPVTGARLREISSPLQAAVLTDDEGRAVIHVPTREDWQILALSEDLQGIRAGRGVKGREVDLDVEPREDLELRWPEELGAVVVSVGRTNAPLAFNPGGALLPKVAISGSLMFWGPAIAPGRMMLADTTSPLPLPTQAAMRVNGRVEAEAGVEVSGLPVWMRMSRSGFSSAGYYSRAGRAEPLKRPWLPWAVTDNAGRFSIAGLPPGACDVEVRAPGYPIARSERLDGTPGALLETAVILRRGAALDLRVVDPEGSPLGGATVELYRSVGKDDSARMAIVIGGRDRWGEPELTATTDDEGRGRLDSAPIGAVRLRLSRPGSVTRSIETIKVPPEGVDIGEVVLEPGVTLTGVTVGPDGEPVGEAEVALERHPQIQFLAATVTSDEDGRFSIPDLEPTGEVYLQARAEGLVPEAPLKVELPPDGEINVAMATERVLDGFVLNARSESPVEGAEVRLNFSREVGIPGSATRGASMMSVGDSKTDPSGRFVFDGLWAGEFQIWVDAEGMRRLHQKIMIAEGDLEPLVIRVEPGLELRGRVETADREPATGVTITASPSSRSWGGGSSDSSRTQADLDGRFHFDALSPGNQSLRARSDEGLTARATAEAGQSEEVVLRFARGGVIRGVVYDPYGAPASAVRIFGYCRDTGQPARDESGPDGRFQLTEVGPCTWTVGAAAEGFASVSEEIEVPEGDTVSVELRLERGAAVVGEVRGLRPSELETCMVRVERGGSANPGADGAFRIEGVEDGETQVIAIEASTRRSRSTQVVVPEAGESAPVVIDFGGGLAVYGRVLRGGTGVSGLMVSVSGVATAVSSQTVSGTDGSWRVEGLEPGEYQIAARSSAGEVLAGDHVLIENDAEVDLYLASGSIRGRVLEADTEQPIEGASVTITGSALPPVRRSAATGSGGAFEISDLGDGDYTVHAEARGRMPAQTSVTIADGASAQVELSLEDDETTVLVVTGADGVPASGIWIQSLGGGVLGPLVSSTCAEGGRCEVRNIPRGRWTLLIQGEGMTLIVADLPGGEIPVRLREGGTLKVKAPTVEGAGVWQVRLSEATTGLVVPVYGFDNPGRGEWVPVPTAGFTHRLPEGAWRIEAFAPDGTQSVQQAAVAAGGTTGVLLE
jgi:protocatechuate 3,4-dioxygenase beta subunit